MTRFMLGFMADTSNQKEWGVMSRQPHIWWFERGSKMPDFFLSGFKLGYELLFGWLHQTMHQIFAAKLLGCDSPTTGSTGTCPNVGPGPQKADVLYVHIFSIINPENMMRYLASSLPYTTSYLGWLGSSHPVSALGQARCLPRPWVFPWNWRNCRSWRNWGPLDLTRAIPRPGVGRDHAYGYLSMAMWKKVNGEKIGKKRDEKLQNGNFDR